MLGLPLRGPRMSKERDRSPLSTELPPPASEVDLHPSGCWTSGLEVPRLHKSADAAAGDRLAIGQMLSGRYRIERELGEGGMGVVYLVSDQQVVGETFAVKVLKEVLDPQALQLLREAALARVVGRPIAVQEGPEEAMAPALTGAGMNAEWARLFQELTHV